MDPARPRVLFVGRTRYRLPLEGALERKFSALGERMTLRVLACAPADAPREDGTFTLVPPFSPHALDGLLFHATLPLRVARELRRFDPDAIIADGPPEAVAALVARALARHDATIVFEVHGDWRTATRLYGSRLRRLLDPIHDRLAVFALRRADAVRTLSAATTSLVRQYGVEPVAAFPAYVDVDTFLERPALALPDRPQALFVGVLERYKNVDGLARAWEAAAPCLPGATLRIVGDGPLRGIVEQLVELLPEQTVWERSLEPSEIAHALDDSSVLVLPSRSEGLPRAAIEALCRGRPVLAARVGGVPDLIDDGVNGFLVEPDDPHELAEALVRVLGNPDALEPVAAECRESVTSWLQTPAEFAERVLAMVDEACGEALLGPEPLRQPERALAKQPVALD